MDRAFVPILKEHDLYNVPLSNSQTKSYIGRRERKDGKSKIILYEYRW